MFTPKARLSGVSFSVALAHGAFGRNNAFMLLLTAGLVHHARSLGFAVVAIAPTGPSPDHDRYAAWVEAGYGGAMDYLVRHTAAKTDPRALLAEAQSLILVGLNYTRRADPALRGDPSRGQIAAYALGDDYHEVMRAALIELDGWLRVQTGRSSQGRVFVDGSPVLERSWAQQAGMGFIGKNTCLIRPGLGSYLFLGGLLVPERLAYDEPPQRLDDEPAGETGHELRLRMSGGAMGTCGRCTRCLDACPTGAFVSPYVLDARRCISYLTIELRGEIAEALRPGMGNWVFGCDVCQDVCPWNRRTPETGHPRLQPQSERVSPPLLDLLALDREGFVRRFRSSPVLRAKWDGFLRNVCVAAGNWGDPAAREVLAAHLNESPPLVAAHAAWALGRLREGAGREVLATASDRPLEPEVKAAVVAALAGREAG